MIIKYTFIDGENSEVEVNEDIGGIILDMNRKESNLERKERYHCYSSDAAAYEGEDYASDEDILSEYIQREDNSSLYAAIDKLKEPQKSRFLQVAEGISMQEIARREGVGYYSVYKSIEAAKKNLKKFLKQGD
jgi:DNA-directed RNA polymerase specialized sigma24 family protein